MATKDYQEDGAPSVGSPNATSAAIREDPYLGMLFKNRYVIEEMLGLGGVGAVYLARDRELYPKLVAVKVLLDESAQQDWFKKKFPQEIEALACINHPGVVEILDAGDTPDCKPFLVMQYIKGHALRSLIKYEGMNFNQVAGIIRQVGRALSAAHEQGVIHCDLKPENIMLQDLGEGEYQAKIVDFGIAKIKRSQVAAGVSDTRVPGTIFYMAPEQVQGKPSAASDIFALGVIAYEMLTGRRPFNPPNQYLLLETLRAGVRLKPKDLRENLPLVAEEILLKALSFDANERYPRARDFTELLAQALTTDLELPEGVAAQEDVDLEMAHVLFMDVVKYTKLSTDEQRAIREQLQRIVSGTESFQRAKTSNQLISRSTGDGMALVFFSGPKAPAECAIEIARILQSHPHIALRMGINSGPVYRVKDVNGTDDVAGAGINMAQRVMDCGDAGHILLSRSVADVFRELGEWRERIHDLGQHRVKHRVPVHLYNFYFNDIGNPKLPKKLRKWRIVLPASLLFAASIALLVYVLMRPSSPMDPSVNEATRTSAILQTNTSPNENRSILRPPNRTENRSIANRLPNTSQNKNGSNPPSSPDPTPPKGGPSWEELDSFVRSQYVEDIDHVEISNRVDCPDVCMRKVKVVFKDTKQVTGSGNGIVTYQPGKGPSGYKKL